MGAFSPDVLSRGGARVQTPARAGGTGLETCQALRPDLRTSRGAWGSSEVSFQVDTFWLPLEPTRSGESGHNESLSTKTCSSGVASKIAR